MISRTMARLILVAFVAGFVDASIPLIERDGWLIWFAASGFTMVFFCVGYVLGAVSMMEHQKKP